MNNPHRDILAHRLKRYDESKKLLEEWMGGAGNASLVAVGDKVLKFAQEYVRTMIRDGTVAPYLGMNLVEDLLTTMLGQELRKRLADLNLTDVVRVVQEVPAKEDAK